MKKAFIFDECLSKRSYTGFGAVFRFIWCGNGVSTPLF